MSWAAICSAAVLTAAAWQRDQHVRDDQGHRSLVVSSPDVVAGTSDVGLIDGEASGSVTAE